MPEPPSPAFEVESIENHHFRFHLLHQQSIFFGSFFPNREIAKNILIKVKEQNLVICTLHEGAEKDKFQKKIPYR